MRMRNFIIGAVVCVSMLVPSTAFAASASQSGYSKPSGSIQEQISTQHDPTETSTTTTAASENKSGNLPFTGLDVALIIAAGGVLLAMGVGIRRLSRTTEVA
jgi:hypothetical protein